MEQQSGGVRKTYKYRLNPTPQQEQALDTVLSRCRTLYNVALEQRKIWWERGQGQSATYYQQKAELPDLKASCPEYAEVNAQVLQDVILRVERTYKDFFRRVRQGAGKGKQHRAIHVSRDRAAITASPIRSMAAAPS
ncbi:MAG TPA: transposase [Ktedonobacterales bacterium]|nr:transposase [Ktedonobacterales bacterium]